MKPIEPTAQQREYHHEESTTELCGHEYAGARCTRQREHDGQHECLYWRGARTLRWTTD